MLLTMFVKIAVNIGDAREVVSEDERPSPCLPAGKRGNAATELQVGEPGRLV